MNRWDKLERDNAVKINSTITKPWINFLVTKSFLSLSIVEHSNINIMELFTTDSENSIWPFVRLHVNLTICKRSAWSWTCCDVHSFPITTAISPTQINLFVSRCSFRLQLNTLTCHSCIPMRIGFNHRFSRVSERLTVLEVLGST